MYYCIPVLLHYYTILYLYHCIFSLSFPTLGVGLLDFKLNSSTSPRPELFSSSGTLLLARSTPRSSPECPTPSVPGVPNSRVSLKCPTPESHWSAQPQSLPGVPSRRVSLECPTPESPWSAQPQSLPEVPNPDCPRSAQPQSISPREGGDVRSNYKLI